MVTMTASMRTVPVLNPIVLRGTSSTSLIIICMFKIEQGFSRLLRTCGITGRRNSWSNFKEHLGYDSAALGPSTAVTVYCKGFYFTDSMHTTYWNDKLTDDEMHIICGSYHWDAGKKKVHYTSVHLLLILLQAMALRCWKFLGGRLQCIGITTTPMASIWETGLSGMKFGTKDEWRIYCWAIKLVFRTRKVTGGLNWKGQRHGEKLWSMSRANQRLSFERLWSIDTYILFIFGEFVICDIT